MADAAREFAGKLAVVDAGLGDVRKRSETPRARLADLIDGFAIFFDRDQIIERAGLRDRLAAIADVLNQSGLGLRVIGYSDDSGSATGNQKISRRRADVIVDLLAERGATRDRLSPVGRATANLVADGTLGARERNRRVTFELADNGEITP
jgi:outer membrane protein OmpA-like peptidoglycan-associated protein